MKVYSHLYGPSPDKGFGVLEQSEGLAALTVGKTLARLSAATGAESASGHRENFYFLPGRALIVGYSWLGHPSETGYNRDGECGMQYVVARQYDGEFAARLPAIVRGVYFDTTLSDGLPPADDVNCLPDGFSYEMEPERLAQWLEALIDVLNDPRKQMFLVAPRAGVNPHTAARAVLTQLLRRLPPALRVKAGFFTDAHDGIDAELLDGAKLLFSDEERASAFRRARPGYGVDCNRSADADKLPAPGLYARVLAAEGDPEEAVAAMLRLCPDMGDTAASLDRAAQSLLDYRENVRHAHESVAVLQRDMERAQAALAAKSGALREAEDERARLYRDLRETKHALDEAENRPVEGRHRREDGDEAGRGARIAIYVVAAVLCVALLALSGVLLYRRFGGGTPVPTPAPVVTPALTLAPTPAPTPTATATPAPTDTPAPTATPAPLTEREAYITIEGADALAWKRDGALIDETKIRAASSDGANPTLVIRDADTLASEALIVVTADGVKPDMRLYRADVRKSVNWNSDETESGRRYAIDADIAEALKSGQYVIRLRLGEVKEWIDIAVESAAPHA